MINIEKLYEVINTINTVGITEAIIDKRNGETRVCGADSTNDENPPSIIVVSDADPSISEHSMGIRSVSTLLKRMKLFDLTKTKVKETEVADMTDNTYLRSIIFKEGRRKASYTFARPFADPAIINVPTGVIDDEITNIITLTKEYVEMLVKVNQAMGSKLFTLTGLNNSITIELFDDDSDSFSDVISDTCVGDWTLNGSMGSMMKLLRHAIKKNDSVELGIGETGIIYIELDELIFMMMPQAV